jgi:hypothetical protein
MARFGLQLFSSTNDSSTGSYGFEVAQTDCYHSILTLNVLLGMRLAEFANSLPAFEISYNLLTDLVVRHLTPL